MNKIFYSSLSLNEEISPSTFEVGGGVIAYKKNNGNISFCELYFGKKLSYVVYMESWPSEEILKHHAAKYPKCKFEIKNQLKNLEHDIIKRYVCLPDGNLEFVIEEIINSEKDIIRENRFDKKNNFIGALEYEYSADGHIILTREIASNGDIISEN